MKKIFVLHLFLAVFLFVSAQQSPYRLNYAKDIGLGVGIIGINVFDLYMMKKTLPMTETQIQGLSVSQIPRIDRFTASQWHPKAAKVSDALLYGSFALPLVLLSDKNMRGDWKNIGILGIESFVTAVALTNLSKSVVKRTRPFVYNPDVPMEYKIEKDARYSFFSGHTSTVANFAFFSAKVYSDYHPQSKALPFVWGGAFALPAATAYLRIRAGKHFPTDVLTGYLIGAAAGFLIPKLHKIK